MEFLRKYAEKIYLTSGINSIEEVIKKVGYSKDIEKRERSYRSHANGTKITKSCKKGDEVDELVQKMYYYYVKEIPLDKDKHPSGEVLLKDFYSKNTEIWFENNPGIKEYFWDNYDTIYFSLSNKDFILEDIYTYELFSSCYGYTWMDNYYVTGAIRSIKSVLFWRLMVSKYGDDFLSLKDYSNSLSTFYRKLIMSYKMSSETIKIFGDLYIKFLTTYNKEIRLDLETQLLNLLKQQCKCEGN